MSWVRVAAASLLLVGLAFVQDPGYIIADTKFDLSVDPGGFLARAGHLWDPQGAFGQLQNQAYGYLWPMGPFFWVGHGIGLDAWVVQRLWIALVLVVALIGATKVTRELGVRSDFACLLAGFAFACSPRVISIIGGVSIEVWPSAMAPWVLLPLIIGAQRGSPRRAAALSALAVGMVGGVNAAATAAVLPLGVVWLLTRTSGTRRRSMMLWWPAFTFLATCWWLIPLFVMGAYSPPFLDFIESASITTFPDTLVNAMRGTSAWIPYVDSGWRAGNDLLRYFFQPLNSGILLFLGIAGIGLRSNPHRLFLAGGLLLGMLMVTFGHTGSVQGWWAVDAQSLLDGVLAPLRNVHKFDPVIRLPLVLGMAFAVQRALDFRIGPAPDPEPGVPSWLNRAIWRAPTTVVSGLAVLAVLVGAMPLLQSRIPTAGAAVEVPGYWTATAAWLGENSQDGVALLAPGSGFGSYTWGSTGDEPMQALAGSAWAVRNAIPLAPPGNIRMLDAVEQRFAQGEASPGLAPYLVRAGVSHVVVRNDLERQADIPDPVLVHQVLRESPGFTRVATFGPEVGGGATLDVDPRTVINGGWQTTYPAIEVFEVAGADGALDASQEPPTVVGGPEDLLDLADVGAVAQEPTTLAVDTDTEEPLAGQLILTDGLLARERFFGRLHDAVSAVLTGDEPGRSGNPTRDYRLADDDDRWSTVRRLGGVAGVSASSSMSDAATAGGSQPGFQPIAAVDDRAFSVWRSGAGKQSAWWQVDFTTLRTLSTVRVVAGSGMPRGQRLRIRTQVGVTDPFTLGPGESRTIDLEGRSRWLRVETAGTTSSEPIELAAVRIPDVRVRRVLELPQIPDAWGNPDSILLRRLADDRTGCVQVAGQVRCNQRDAGRADEEPSGIRRIVHLPQAVELPATLRVVMNPRGAENTIQADRLAQARSSSQAFRDPRASAVAAIDGNPGTTWIASDDAAKPSLRLRWVGATTVRGVQVRLTDSASARRPSTLRVSWPTAAGSRFRKVELDRRGIGRFPAVRTDRLTITVLAADSAVDLGFDSVPQTLPIGISDVRLIGTDVFPVPVDSSPVSLPCGSGPNLNVNGTVYRTRVNADRLALLRGETVLAGVCGAGSVALKTGRNSIGLSGGNRFLADSLLLGDAAPAEATELAGDQDGPVRQSIAAPPAGDWLIGDDANVNAGWTAQQGGESLPAQTVDGWRQGWWTQGDAGTVSASFQPDRAYRGGLIVGGLAALLLIGLVGWGRRWTDRGESLAGRPLPLAARGAIACLSGGLLAGWPGLVVAVATLAVTWWSQQRDTDWSWLIAVFAFVGAVGYVLSPWGSDGGWAGDSAWPDYFALIALVGVVVLGPDADRERPRSRSRMAGSSTTR